MRKIINWCSFVLLIVVVSAIWWITSYTLKNKGIREEVENKVFKNIENISSNMTSNTLTEIFNIYLNDEKHKIKFDYHVSINEEKVSINLVAYFDGKSVIDENVLIMNKSEELRKIDDVFSNENVSDFVRLKEKNLKIVDFDGIQYLVVDLGYFNTFYKEKYFIINKEANVLTENGILVRDDAAVYSSKEEKDLKIFYDNDKQVLAKIQDGYIYALVPIENGDMFDIKEYKYTIREGILEEELINTYVDISKIKVVITE